MNKKALTDKDILNIIKIGIIAIIVYIVIKAIMSIA